MAEQKIKDVPMRTVDGVDFKVGMTLFYSDPKTQYDYESKRRAKTRVLKSMEVTHVNLTHRNFMVRKDDGTETKFIMSGRAIKEFFGKESGAKKFARDEMMQNIHELEREISEKNRVLKLMVKDYKSI
nr:hypothetical protein BdHM001_18550 [Bdellovibrio sp. HM001]